MPFVQETIYYREEQIHEPLTGIRVRGVNYFVDASTAVMGLVVGLHDVSPQYGE